ncbi:MAG: ATPase, BadF/BadG/BcrA/BcrD type [Bryobacterales bacterium]|nr:ATPase, BadF/BadG/BcrA/BcrD type [Bryobacterales bacterium]
MSEFFLGVDGGQSSTTAVIGNSAGQVVGWASAGPCNHVGAAEGRAKFLRVMGECLSQAATRAGLDPARPRFEAACLGMSGGPDDKAALLNELFEAKHLEVTHDGRIALAGATGGQPGIIVVAGTGSIAFGENAIGETARAGGWGYIFGDEGGGFDIVRQALRAILREHEGWGTRTALTPALLEATGATDANQLLHAFYTTGWPRAKVATLSRVVNAIAEQSDPTAQAILQNAAQSLAALAKSVRHQLWQDPDPDQPVTTRPHPQSESYRAVTVTERGHQSPPIHLSWIGGVFGSTLLLNHFQTLIQTDPAIHAAPPQHSPAIGALILAWKSAGIIANPAPVPGVKT